MAGKDQGVVCWYVPILLRRDRILRELNVPNGSLIGQYCDSGLWDTISQAEQGSHAGKRRERDA